jgi:hypothetical protein
MLPQPWRVILPCWPSALRHSDSFAHACHGLLRDLAGAFRRFSKLERRTDRSEVGAVVFAHGSGSSGTAPATDTWPK